ncbi:MAG: hypothetical protein H0X08_01845 [Blastocatellia bacterium]|nr:hypothetical protein [Blastocatellia bacterium]
MPTQITQIDDTERRTIVLRLAGEMFREDAELLSRISKDASDEAGLAIELDLADVTLIDSEAASILRGLSDEYGFKIVGTEILLQTAVDVAERA